MSENKKDNKNIGQFLKFVAFSCSAGLIQIGSFTLMSEVLIKLSFFQGLMQCDVCQNNGKRIRPHVSYRAYSFCCLEFHV